jgi:hypothetical protein
MIDSPKLLEVVRGNIETLCCHFFPNGKKVNGEWKLGNVSGAEGNSLGVCLSADKAGLWHDRATGEKGNFVKLIESSKNLTFPGAAQEIGRILGVDLSTHYQPNEINWDRCARLASEHVNRMAIWRGLSEQFVKWLSEHDLLRVYGNNGSERWVFPVHMNGKISGCHSRPVEWAGPDRCPWLILPEKKKGGPGVQPLMIGDLANARSVHVFESQWDMFAVCDRLNLHETDSAAAFCTRGSANGGLVSTMPDTVSEVFLWQQNDDAGTQWTDAIIRKLPITATARLVKTPSEFEDPNDWILKGRATSDGLFTAISAAVALQAPKQEEPAGETEGGKDSLDWLQPRATSFLTTIQPDEILRGILYKGCKGILTGGSKSYKTWALMDIAYCVGNGLLWWGTHTLQCPVTYLDFEHIDYDFRWRMEQIAAAHGKGSIDAVKRIGLRSRRLTTGHWTEIREQITKGNSGLVVADPTYKLLPPRGDENAAGDIAEVTHTFDVLSEQTGAAVIYAQHYSKGNQAQKESIDRAAGSGVWARDADAIICMTKHDAGDDCLTIETTLRSFPRIEPFVVRWNLPLFERAPDLDPADLKQSSKPGGSTAKYSIDDLVKTLGVKDLKTEEFKKLVQSETGMSHGKFYELLKAGQTQGKLHKSQTDDKWEVVRK